jgi:pimeloyl-ACP methyl ester carboxylesterase
VPGEPFSFDWIARSKIMTETALLVGLVLAPVLISYVLEALRSEPTPPDRLAWAPDIPVRYVEVHGLTIRYIVAGEGPALVLLHTLRTQLDMFQKVVPELARHFRVYALDHPGHGYSDIPRTHYTADFFVETVAGFLERLDIQQAAIVGESIGGTIGLLLAARRNPRVARVLAVNPYDYGKGRGLRRSSLLANAIFGLSEVPILGATVMRLRQFPIEKRVFEGGVKRKQSIPQALLREMYGVGERRGHYQAFMSLIHHWPEWEQAREEYGKINRPVLLLYGDGDWSRKAEREANARAIPGARISIVPDAGHFLSIEAPAELVRGIGLLTEDRGAVGGPGS